MIRKWYRAVFNTSRKKDTLQPIWGADQSHVDDTECFTDYDPPPNRCKIDLTDQCLKLVSSKGLREIFHKKEISWYSKEFGETRFLGRTLCIVPKNSTKVFHMPSKPGTPHSLVRTFKRTWPHSATRVEIGGFLIEGDVTYKVVELEYNAHATLGDTLTINFEKMLLGLSSNEKLFH